MALMLSEGKSACIALEDTPPPRVCFVDLTYQRKQLMLHFRHGYNCTGKSTCSPVLSDGYKLALELPVMEKNN